MANQADQRDDEDRDLRNRSRASLVATVGALTAIVFGAIPTSEGGSAIFHLGAGAASISGIVAIGAMPALSGMLGRKKSGTIGLSIAMVGLGWVAAIAVPTSNVLAARGDLIFDHDLVDRLGAGAGLGTLAVYAGAASLEVRARRLELAAYERLVAFGWLTLPLFGLAVVAGALRLARVETIAPVLAAIGGVLASLVAAAKRPEKLGRAGARMLAIGGIAGVPAVIGAACARAFPHHADAITLGTAGLVLVGTFVGERAAVALAPRGEPWAEPFQAATDAAMTLEPDMALERALHELRGIATSSKEAPSAYRYDPPSVTTVDRAGFAQSESADVPESLARFASEEPFQVLRRAILDAVAVRRPEVRAGLAWMEDRRLGAVALLGESDLPLGLLAIPEGERTTPLGLVEISALRQLADRLGAAIGASLALERSRARETVLRTESGELSQKLKTLDQDLLREHQKGEALARTLASRARKVAYSPAARMAIEDLERMAASNRPVALLVPPGVDPLGFVAVYHLASKRSDRTLLVLDGRDPSLADLEKWRTPGTSPLVLSQGGTLAILEPERIPKLVQAFVGARLDPSISLALVVPRTVDALCAQNLLDERLADAVGDRAVAIPPLADRPEDLRPMALDVLVRLGLRLRGKPFGIDHQALALLAEHDFPANDVELEALLTRAAVELEGEVIGKADLVRAGFSIRARP